MKIDCVQGGYRHSEGAGGGGGLEITLRVKIFGPRPQTAEIEYKSQQKGKFRHFWCIFVVNFMIDPSLRRLHWLGGGGGGRGARAHFCIKKAYNSGLKDGVYTEPP